MTSYIKNNKSIDIVTNDILEFLEEFSKPVIFSDISKRSSEYIIEEYEKFMFYLEEVVNNFVKEYSEVQLMEMCANEKIFLLNYNDDYSYIENDVPSIHEQACCIVEERVLNFIRNTP